MHEYAFVCTSACVVTSGVCVCVCVCVRERERWAGVREALSAHMDLKKTDVLSECTGVRLQD